MSTQNLCRALLLVFLGCFLSQPAGAQLVLPHDVLGCGGGSSSTATLRLEDTVGEGVIGVMSEGSIVHEIGFHYVVKTFLGEMIRVASKTVALLENRWDWRKNAKTQFRIPENYGTKWFYLNRYSAEEARKVFEDKGMKGYALVSKTEDWQLTVYKK